MLVQESHLLCDLQGAERGNVFYGGNQGGFHQLLQDEFVAAGLIFLQEPQELGGRLVFCRQQTGAAHDVLQEQRSQVPQS